MHEWRRCFPVSRSWQKAERSHRNAKQPGLSNKHANKTPLQPPRWRTALQTPSLDRPQRQTTQTRTVNNPLTVANSQHGLAHHTGDWSLFVSFFFLLEGRGTVKESQYLNNRFFFF